MPDTPDDDELPSTIGMAFVAPAAQPANESEPAAAPAAQPASASEGEATQPASATVHQLAEHRQRVGERGGGGRGARSADVVEAHDIGVANLFIARFGEDVRYLKKFKAWYVWDTIRWREDWTHRVEDWVRRLCEELGDKADTNKAQAERASHKKVAAVLALARTYHAEVNMTPDQFDRDANLLNTPRGVVDLRTGELRPARRDDYMTMVTAVAPTPPGEPSACPRWDAFMRRIHPSAAVREFLDMWGGYCLTGHTREHSFAIHHGTGSNGKSVMLTTQLRIWGDYGISARIEAFTFTQNEAHPTEIARLAGKRFVVANETEQGRRLAESRIKLLTGGDRVVARFMRKDEFEFEPQLKLNIVGNFKPRLSSTDEAMRRRLLLVPYATTIPEAERDEGLSDALWKEAPAILDRFIEGAHRWYAEGLCKPPEVRAATDDYIEGEDVLGQFLTDECVTGEAADALAKVLMREQRDRGRVLDDRLWSGSSQLFAAWKSWKLLRGELAGSEKGFIQALTRRPELGLRERRSSTGNRGFTGIGLKL
jgi:putative DNA primase/helicase